MNIDELLAQLTLDEKITLTAGAGIWHVDGIERLDIPPLTMTDGPNGARGSSVLGIGRATAACLPCGSALGATWNPSLIEEAGELLGAEARTKRARILLAPTINLHRSPIAGRNFECYSEDPFLSGQVAASYVRGVQSQGVAATAKHFIGNEAEFERNTISSDIDDRSLRELYLVPFEQAVKEGGLLAVMTSYNRVNGVYCTENPWLLQELLRDEWGFEGIVMTDWFGAASADVSPAAGLDVEMPGKPRAYGDNLRDAVTSGATDERDVDAMVRRWLGVVDRLNAWGDEPGVEQSIDLPEHRELARRLATESIVLLKNEASVLPLSADDVGRVVALGPLAQQAHIMGGGSAQLVPHYRVAPIDPLVERLGEAVETHRCFSIDKNARPLTDREVETIGGVGGFTAEFFPNRGFEGAPAHIETAEESRFLYFDAPAPGVEPSDFSLRASATWTPDVSGPHEFELVQNGTARLIVGGELILDGGALAPGPGTQIFGLVSEEMTAEVDLVAGEPVDVVVEFVAGDSFMLAGAKLGVRAPDDDGAFERAVAAAAAADTALVFVGTSAEWETEGEDRASMKLPGRQDELVERVAAVNDRTIVIVNAGAPIEMPWIDQVSTVLHVWLGGQEMAAAIDEVLFGVSDPGGRLPTTFPQRVEHNPSYGNFPGENDHVLYGEGLLMGYRWYDTRKLPVLFPFGHGGSYTTFAWGDLELSTTAASVEQPLTVEVEVTNTGDRPGVEVVQCYVRPHQAKLERPERELKGFAKLHLEPGESATARIELDARSFAYWDPASPDRAALDERNRRTYVPAGFGAQPRDVEGWYIDEGDYTVELGRSVTDIQASATVNFAQESRIGPDRTDP